MKYPHLIILYGRFGDKPHDKQQAMIDGKTVCGYRDYAKKFGEIIYLCPQEVKGDFDRVFTQESALLSYLKHYPHSVIWSIKHDPTKQKDKLLERLPNKKVYYSCCSYNTTNPYCGISLVDTQERVKGNAVLWVKGKDPDFWKPQGSKKVFDYCMIGKRGDKNEVWFVEQLTKQIKEKRNIIWIGGEKHAYKMPKTHHNIVCTAFSGPEVVRNYIDLARVGVILSEIPAEGFPQSFLEMTMMGLPVVYMGPNNNQYFTQYNHELVTDKKDAVGRAERIISSVWLNNLTTVACRNGAINNYSLEKSYESILKHL